METGCSKNKVLETSTQITLMTWHTMEANASVSPATWHPPAAVLALSSANTA